jgi:CRP-like cAMP-binding protein
MSEAATPPPAGTTLSHIALFARLDAAGDDALLGRLTRKTVQENEPVFWFGDSGDTLYIIDSGRVAVTAPDADGNHVLLDTLGPGGIFGELSLLDGGPRSATVRAISDCSLLALNREAFHDFLRERPDAAIDILQVLGARQRTSTATIRGMRNPIIVSLEAIFLSIFVLVSQNRQSERDRIRTDLDYQVNVKAHVEIMGIVERLDRIERAVVTLRAVRSVPAPR